MNRSEQLIVELVDSEHWQQLREEAAANIRYLELEALKPAEDTISFYRKEGAARAAKELALFLIKVEKRAKELQNKSDRYGVKSAVPS